MKGFLILPNVPQFESRVSSTGSKLSAIVREGNAGRLRPWLMSIPYQNRRVHLIKKEGKLDILLKLRRIVCYSQTYDGDPTSGQIHLYNHWQSGFHHGCKSSNSARLGDRSGTGISWSLYAAWHLPHSISARFWIFKHNLIKLEEHKKKDLK